jgi:spore maturation protein CgeB
MKEKIKKALLSLPPVRRCNKYIKGRSQKKRYTLWSKLYEDFRVSEDVHPQLIASFNKSNLHFRFKKGGILPKLKVFYIGADESQDHTGFLQALSQFAECKIFRQKDGKYGQYPGMPGHRGPREKMTSELESELFNLSTSGWIPDILLMQAWGFTFTDGSLAKIKEKYGCFVINIGMDERLIFSHGPIKQRPNDGLIGVARESDLVLVTSPECVSWYEAEGIPAYYFPLASDPNVYYPQQIEKIYDIGFIGHCYGLREIMIRDLEKRGLRVQAHGTGWPAGRIPYDENNRFFNSCKVILGVGNVGYCNDLFTLKLRDFDALMSGGVYVTHYNPALASLFENEKDLVLCKNIDEFELKIKTLLSNEEMRQRISLSAVSVARSKHTYENRFERLDNLFKALSEDTKWINRSHFYV